MKKMGLALAMGGLLLLPLSVGAFEITLNALSGFSPQASAAFGRAAAQWESRISDPINVTIDSAFIDFSSSNIIGSASSIQVTTRNDSYGAIRGRMVIDAANEPDDVIVSYLPTTASELFVNLPTGFDVSGLVASKANMKALGFEGLDDLFGDLDGLINFNTDFSFDYDNSDGVDPGAMDFETVAAHEIGHILGFQSSLDHIVALMDSGLPGSIRMTPLDLFRFEEGVDPSTPEEFTLTERSLVPGTSALFDDILNEIPMEDGDPRQASHWLDGEGIGLMDPTLSRTEVVLVSEADLRALDLIGYEIFFIPLPAAFWLFGSALIGLAAVGRRHLSLSV